MSILSRWFASLTGRHDPNEVVAAALYRAAVAQARQPDFYVDGAVSDTVDGRFDAIALHVWLLLRHLRAKGEKAEAVAQALFDVFMGDMDRSLREMGAGDLGVGKRVKVMAEALMGRVKAYDAGLEAKDPGSLIDALQRNLLRGVPVRESAPAARVLVEYVSREAAAFEARDVAMALRGEVEFGPPPRVPALPSAPELL